MPIGRHKVTEREEKSELPFEVEANQPEDPDKPVPMPTTKQMANKASWVHYSKSILSNNKTSHTIGEEAEDREKEVDRLLTVDPYEARLKPITLDRSCKGSNSAWILRSYGDQVNYSMANPLHGAKQYSVVAVKSTIWPGALSYFW